MQTKYTELPLVPFRKSFAQTLLDSAETFSNNPALWVDDETYSYSAMAIRALGIAATLQTINSKAENCGIFAYRSATAYQGIWGALLAGNCYLPLNPGFPADKNHTILKAAECSVIIVDRRSEEAARQVLLKLDKKISVLLPEHSRKPSWCWSTPHDYLCQGKIKKATAWQMPDMVSRYAYLLFTSGTTGEPKGIAVTHENMNTYVKHIVENHTLTAADRFSQMSDLTFDLSVHDMCCAWKIGASLYVTPESSLLCPAEFIKHHEITCWHSVPSLLGFMNKFGKIKPDAFPHLRYSFFCGEAMPTVMADKWAKATPNGKLINLYGPTEATVAITAFEHQPEQQELPNLPIGMPFSDQEAIVVNSHGERVIAGEKGELWLGGSQVADGYWHDREKSRQCFIEKTFTDIKSTHWYQTGDIVSWHDNYGLIFHGREDFQVKINGFRVELGEIEAVIHKAFPCDWVTVIPWPVDSTGAAKGLVAWLSNSYAHANIHAQDVRQHCMEKLPPYMVPGHVYWQAELPRNANGKIDIIALQQLAQKKSEDSKQ